MWTLVRPAWPAPVLMAVGAPRRSLVTLARARRAHRRALRLANAERHAEAVVAAEAAVRLLESAGRPRELAAARMTLGDLRFQLGEHAAAVEAFSAAGAEGLLPLGNCLRVLGRFAEAEFALAAAPARPATRNAFGVLCKDTGRYEEAARHYAAALADPALHGVVHHNLAGLAHAQGRYEEALIAALTALVWHARERGCNSPEVAADAAVLGAIQLGLGRLDDAAASLGRARDIWQRRYGPEHYETRICRRGLAAVERARQRA
ncbi:tetratricopeptide repeat protein [Dactylosporangium sp. NPDC051541]|uniref:tetratricopeptide repeat protein n=1 Tax=Dactylosporangium sp. NPDC051541 TaxID=3363977 RepID=UPI0037929417